MLLQQMYEGCVQKEVYERVIETVTLNHRNKPCKNATSSCIASTLPPPLLLPLLLLLLLLLLMLLLLLLC